MSADASMDFSIPAAAIPDMWRLRPDTDEGSAKSHFMVSDPGTGGTGAGVGADGSPLDLAELPHLGDFLVAVDNEAISTMPFERALQHAGRTFVFPMISEVDIDDDDGGEGGVKEGGGEGEGKTGGGGGKKRGYDVTAFLRVEVFHPKEFK